MGVQYVITGHSEAQNLFRRYRRHRTKRTRAALDAGLTVNVSMCVGEYLAAEQGVTAGGRYAD